jgi:hypothetical protein
MFKVTIDKDQLKKSMDVACLATENSEHSITGHCLFEFKGKTLKVLATDKRNLLSQSIIEMPVEIDNNFTIDPRKILTLLKTAESESLTFQYDPDKATVQVFLTDSEDSFVSLPSIDPTEYAPIGDVFTKAFDLKPVNAGVLLEGIRFIKGFLEPKDKVFSNLYISNGVLYGSNGSTVAGAFTCPDLCGLDDLVFPLSILPSVMGLINSLDLQDILIQTTSNNIIFASPDKNHVFGFTKVKAKMPKIPVNVKDPDGNGWTLNKSTLSKKLKCFHITGNDDLGVKGIFESEVLRLSTIADRSSKDLMACKKIKESTDTFFVVECRTLEDALTQFGGSEIDLFVLEKKIILYNKAELEITEKDAKVVKPFTSVVSVVRSIEEV